MFLPKRLGRLMCCPFSIARRAYSQRTLSEFWDSVDRILNPNRNPLSETMAADYAATKESAEHWQFNDTKQLRIRPLVFSDTKSDWVYHENRSDQHGLGVGTILPVVFWTLRFFGPEEYIATRSLAAMSLLRDIFGKKPRPMAIMLQDVDPEILKSILEHEWVRRNFAVGFDHTPIKFDGWGHVYTPVSSVMMVSKQLRTANWILTRYGQFIRGTKAFEGRPQQHQEMDSSRPPREENGHSHTVYRSQVPKKEVGGNEEIHEIRNTAQRQRQDRSCCVRIGAFFTDRSGRRRSAYKWQQMGAASRPQDTENVRTSRLVQIRLPNPDDLEELEELNDNMRKNGINSKVSLGTFPKGKRPLVPAHSDITSNRTPWRYWPHSELGWPRNHVQSDGAADLRSRRCNLKGNMAHKEFMSTAKSYSKYCQKSFRMPSLAPLRTNDGRFNYDLFKGEVFMWVSDDYGIAKGVKITDNKPGKDKNFSGVV
ncbi:hypothetical protein BKA81DRAFT_376050 [Phyllosticta paracitricarpa]